MQCEAPHWILDQEKDISGRTGGNPNKSKYSAALTKEYCTKANFFVLVNVQVIYDANIRGNWTKYKWESIFETFYK